VDESVRRSWELNTDQFSLKNPAWNGQIDKLLQEAVSDLGLMARPTEIKAELYKLLVYEEGAFFLPHRDSEKADGMFGTLVVSLPSRHEGGDVVAMHKGDSLTFSSSQGSDFGFSYAAWYSDVTHEVKAVTSGYRLVLTYNLIHRPSAASLENLDNTSAKLISSLESWATLCQEVYPSEDEPVEWDLDDDDDDDDDDCPRALLYTLNHKYTSAELSFSRLKGVDQGQVSEARKACKKTGFSLFLVNIEKTDIGDVEGCYGWGYDNSGHHYISSLGMHNA
jgi:2OG-Fe(II) oxygenase superfamily